MWLLKQNQNIVDVNSVEEGPFSNQENVKPVCTQNV